MRLLTPEEKKILLICVLMLLGSLLLEQGRRWGIVLPLPRVLLQSRSRPVSSLPPSQSVRFPLDLNRATFQELLELPHIGPALAARIVEARQKKGRFAKPEEILEVEGIGAKKWKDLRGKIKVE